MNGLLKEGITLGWKATQCQLGCKLGSQVAPSKLETVDGRKRRVVGFGVLSWSVDRHYQVVASGTK